MNVLFIRTFLAEKEGFEPSIPFWGIHDFQSCALGQLRDFSISYSPCGQLDYITAFFVICQALKDKKSIISIERLSRPLSACSISSFCKCQECLCVQFFVLTKEYCKFLSNLLCAAHSIAFDIQRQQGIM